MSEHLNATLRAINDGCNVKGFAVWSIIDNFEWLAGFTYVLLFCHFILMINLYFSFVISEKFGMYSVNLSSTEKERIQKESAKFYRKVIESRRIPNAT